MAEERAARVCVTSSTERDFDPDYAMLSISIEGGSLEKDDCTARFNERFARVCDALVQAGVVRDDIKTESFAISIHWESLYRPYEKSDGYYYSKRVPNGYSYDGELSVKLPVDEDLTARVWVALSDCGDGVTFSIDYALRSREAAVAEIMEEAVREAIAKAGALARGAGKRVGQVLRIDYGTPLDAGYGNTRVYAAETCAAGNTATAPAFTPHPITISCEVQVECEMIANE